MTQIKKIKDTHFIEAIENKIKITLMCDKQIDYVSNNKILWEILQKKELRPYRTGDRLAFIVQKRGNSIRFYLYDLAMACYGGWLSVNTYLVDIERYQEWKSANHLSVDHADNNRANNTIFNLSLMSGELNRIKAAIVTHFTPPYALVSAYCDGEYRVRVGMRTLGEKSELLKNVGISGEAYFWLNFCCRSADEYVSCLKYLERSTYEWMDNTAHENWHDDKDNLYVAGDIQKSMFCQKMLSLMDEKAFNVFENGTEKSA